MTRCHPAMAWARMKAGASLRDVAAEFGDHPTDLDKAVWHWRAVKTNTNPTRGRQHG